MGQACPKTGHAGNTNRPTLGNTEKKTDKTLTRLDQQGRDSRWNSAGMNLDRITNLAGQVPGGRRSGGSHTLIFRPLSFSLPSPL